ncbi:CPBP family intramembrane glutamic endopeptidase [Lacticaseibacillus mingshuiensis]|uniref:CPBP family intramembrane glutamic endopeptidase n=1 Tax=Lacticaseibacillus mingshuiensis TaxID=2799574 RepID=UPI00194E4877|nr:CPBP family intramembrane glutamic endopeptidase [Lacticaseibacillus mingshuiensis]
MTDLALLPKHLEIKSLAVLGISLVSLILFAFMFRHGPLDENARVALVQLIVGLVMVGLSVSWLRLPLFEKPEHLVPALGAAALIITLNCLDLGRFPGWSWSRLGEALLLGLAAGVMEEILCRGPLLFILAKHAPSAVSNTWFAAVVSAIIFGLLHLLNAGGAQSLWQTGLQVIYTMTFGLAMAALFLTTHNLLVPILAHTLFDTITYYFDLNGTSSMGGSWWGWLSFAALTGGCLVIGLALMGTLPRSPRISRAINVPTTQVAAKPAAAAAPSDSSDASLPEKKRNL